MAGPVKALVAARWLAEAVRSNRVGPSLRVLDASWYLPKLNRDAREEFRQCHIPGASFFDIDKCSDVTSRYDHMLPSSGQFAEYVGALGINNRTHVVVYDGSDLGSFSAPRVWWMFRLFGHDSVSVLDGGLKTWRREGHPVTDQPSEPDRTEFSAALKNPSWVKTYEDVLENLERSDSVPLVDARVEGRFRGLEPEPREGKSQTHIKQGSLKRFFWGSVQVLVRRLGRYLQLKSSSLS